MIGRILYKYKLISKFQVALYERFQLSLQKLILYPNFICILSFLYLMQVKTTVEFLKSLN